MTVQEIINANNEIGELDKKLQKLRKEKQRIVKEILATSNHLMKAQIQRANLINEELKP